MHDSGTGTQAGGPASALRLGLSGIAELWSQLWLGIDNKVLTQLMDGLRFADGQGQLWPLRVLALDARLRRPLRAAGCAVVVDEAPYPAERVPTGPELADALCALLTTTDLIPLARGYARRVRLGGLVVLCSRPAFPARPLLAAALLHAGLTEVVQVPAGRVVLTAGRVTYWPEPGLLPPAPDGGPPTEAETSGESAPLH